MPEMTELERREYPGMDIAAASTGANSEPRHDHILYDVVRLSIGHLFRWQKPPKTTSCSFNFSLYCRRKRNAI